MSDPNPSGANVRSTAYYVALAFDTCGHCGGSTRVIALALPPDHETLESETEATWQRAGAMAVLFFIASLPEAVQRRLSEECPTFRLVRAVAGADPGWGSGSHPGWGSGSDPVWANHCEHCGSALDDQELHGEPGGAFLPTSDAEASRIELIRVEDAFEADASGYTLAPTPWPSTSSI